MTRIHKPRHELEAANRQLRANLEKVTKDLEAVKAAKKKTDIYSAFLLDKYQVLWNCTELLPAAVAQQLAIINLNVGEWEETEQFYEITLPAVHLKVKNG
jgi:hypothetical protein